MSERAEITRKKTRETFQRRRNIRARHVWLCPRGWSTQTHTQQTSNNNKIEKCTRGFTNGTGNGQRAGKKILCRRAAPLFGMRFLFSLDASFIYFSFFQVFSSIFHIARPFGPFVAKTPSSSLLLLHTWRITIRPVRLLLRWILVYEIGCPRVFGSVRFSYFSFFFFTFPFKIFFFVLHSASIILYSCFSPFFSGPAHNCVVIVL